MNDKPKMYHNITNKRFNNNRMVYNSYDQDSNALKEITDSNEIRKKINDIINANNFIYSKSVHIVTLNGIITRKIIGIYNNNVVTIDNEYIPIDNIKDIYLYK